METVLVSSEYEGVTGTCQVPVTSKLWHEFEPPTEDNYNMCDIPPEEYDHPEELYEIKIPAELGTCRVTGGSPEGDPRSGCR